MSATLASVVPTSGSRSRVPLILIALAITSVCVHSSALAQLACLPNYSGPYYGLTQNDAHFGKAVATAGDVNGDGFSDIIMAAPDADFGGPLYDEGYFEVLLGSVTGLWSTGGSVVGDQYFENLGNSVSAAGDVNGDGYDDVIVGAWQYTNGESGEGRAYIWFGSTAPNPISGSPDWTAEINLAGALFGSSVCTAGDVNGDGYADVVVGARGVGGGLLGAESGAVYVYYGSPSGPSTSYDAVLFGWTESAHFGSWVATAGDVNGDGYDDILVGAPGYDAFGNTANDNGKVFAYYGSPSGIGGTENWSVTGGLGSQLGTSVCTAGDVNGDGYADVIVGAPKYTPNLVDVVGRADVYLGGPTGLATTPVWTQVGVVTGQRYGIAVSTAGDLDGDGYAEIIVGSPGAPGYQGHISVYFGSSAGPSTSPCTRTSGSFDTQFGSAVCTAGDVNGDGFSEIIVGEPYRDLTSPNYSNLGTAWVFTGGQRYPSEAPGWIASDGAADTDNGHAASTAGDVNGDGYSDVIVGAPNYSNFMSGHGRARLYLGTAYGLSTSPSWSSSQSGTSVVWSFGLARWGCQRRRVHRRTGGRPRFQRQPRW